MQSCKSLNVSAEQKVVDYVMNSEITETGKVGNKKKKIGTDQATKATVYILMVHLILN